MYVNDSSKLKLKPKKASARKVIQWHYERTRDLTRVYCDSRSSRTGGGNPLTTGSRRGDSVPTCTWCSQPQTSLIPVPAARISKHSETSCPFDVCMLSWGRWPWAVWLRSPLLLPPRRRDFCHPKQYDSGSVDLKNDMSTVIYNDKMW